MKYCICFFFLFLIAFKGFSQTRIDITEVSKHVGDSVLVVGKVSDTSYSQADGVKVLRIVQPNGGSFDVLIKNENRNNFQFLSQNDVFNKYVRIVGKIIVSNGRNRIYVTSGNQLAIVLGE